MLCLCFAYEEAWRMGKIGGESPDFYHGILCDEEMERVGEYCGKRLQLSTLKIKVTILREVFLWVMGIISQYLPIKFPIW